MLIRKNSDIKYVIIYHTGHVSPVSAEIVNNEHLQIGDFGAPYDIIIDKYGTMSLTPRWVRSQKSNLLETNISASNIFKYKEHFYSDVTPSYYQGNSLNIAVIGNFDIERPNSLIFSALISILGEVIYTLDLSLQTSVLYYSEVVNNTSPGVFFFDKYYLINYVTRTSRIINVIPYENIVIDTNSYRLLEDGGIRLLEDGGRRLLETSV
jgi:hypothetical protein